jgi:hypothetical protein
MIKIKYAQRTGEQQIWEGNEDIDVIMLTLPIRYYSQLE